MSDSSNAEEPVTRAIKVAKDYVRLLFKGEQISNLGLEEVESLGSTSWRITVGFSRPWDDHSPRQYIYTGLGSNPKMDRTYKVVDVDLADGSVSSVRHRDFSN